MDMEKKNLNKGFSLVELIIVIAIMAILAAAVAPALIRYIDKSRITDDVNTASTIAKAVELALGEEQPWDDYMHNGPVQNVNWSSMIKQVSSNVDGQTQTYDVEIVATSTVSSNYAFSSGIRNGYMNEVFCNAVNANLGISVLSDAESNRAKLPFKYRKIPDGGTARADHWIICKNIDTSEVEIWIATEGSNDPVYRITPNICDEYNK
ncbi:MAG: prepilin-type N-terminal cleavage/methylation domain-containing protein [Eubacterium sp.]|nr:prepilin-type N-terminal cleavage/methylation domain-containing protein [Eubacterium sp.]